MAKQLADGQGFDPEHSMALFIHATAISDVAATEIILQAGVDPLRRGVLVVAKRHRANMASDALRRRLGGQDRYIFPVPARVDVDDTKLSGAIGEFLDIRAVIGAVNWLLEMIGPLVAYRLQQNQI